MKKVIVGKNKGIKPISNRFYILLCTVLTFLNLKFNVTQYRWGRKLYKGTWYYIDPKGLSMCAFWSDTEITSCQSQTLGIERY
jgi:hypothetical protein